MGLSDGERISMIRSAVLIQYTRVTDGRTDGIGVAYTRYSIYAVARKNVEAGPPDTHLAPSLYSINISLIYEVSQCDWTSFL